MNTHRIALLIRFIASMTGLLFTVGLIHAQTIYSEDFTNTLSSGNMYLSNFGWSGYRDANAASLSASYVYIPQNLGNPNTDKGYVALSPGTTGTFAVVKTFSSLDAGGCWFTWSMGNSLSTADARLLVKVGANWYASNEDFNNASTYTAATFASTTTADVRRFLGFSTAAANWRSFTLTPGSAMSLGAVLGSDLTSSQITGVGFYINAPAGSPVVRLDSLALTIPEPIYSEEFTNTFPSGNEYLSDLGWSGYRDSNAAALSVSYAYIPQNLGNPNTNKGYFTLSPGTAGTFAVVKTFSGLDAAGCWFAWSMGNSLTTANARLLVKVGANWYASNEVFNNTATYTAATFASTTTADVRRVFGFSTAAANWRSFTLEPGSAMSLGSVIGSDLVSSKITGIGFYVTTPEGSPVVRLDSLEVTPSTPRASEPSTLPPGAAALGYSVCVIDEQPVAADIAPFPNSTGNYKWFRGVAFVSNPPPADASHYTTTNGVLTLLRKADGVNPSLAGTPHDFSNGFLPTLSGADGFYIEFDVRLSDNDTDHWPAVWLMPVEHNGSNPLGDVYPGDPSGYERFMELDVDEGGIRPGSLATVISWSGIWNGATYPGYEPHNSWNQSANTLDRTQIHTFGASYDPIESRVTWWLDGVQYFTADASHVPAIAALQHFYPILSAQSKGSNIAYSMYVSGVRAFVPPAREPLVTGTTLGNVSNAYTRWQGAQFTVGSSNITVTELGRMMAAGNTGTHTIKLVDAATGQDVTGGDVSVNMNYWRSGQFKYGRLTTPVVLQANHTYHVVSSESAGGDNWYNEQSAVTTTSAVSAISPVWGPGDGSWNVISPPGKEFGPLDIKYLVTP